MRAVIQRVQRGAVSIEGHQVAEIGRGLVILLGVGPADTAQTCQALAKKIALLRIFEDEHGKMNLSLLDIKGEALVVSQFTLYADARKGNRPSFTESAPPEIAQPLVEQFSAALMAQGIRVQSGIFGAHMLVNIENDGPVTIWLEREQPIG